MLINITIFNLLAIQSKWQRSERRTQLTAHQQLNKNNFTSTAGYSAPCLQLQKKHSVLLFCKPFQVRQQPRNTVVTHMLLSDEN